MTKLALSGKKGFEKKCRLLSKINPPMFVTPKVNYMNLHLNHDYFFSFYFFAPA